MDPLVAKKIDEIKNDHAHGATTLARWGLEALLLAVEKSQAATVDQFLQEVRSIAQAVAARLGS